MDPPISSWRRLTFIEPVTFFIMFSFSISDSVITDMIVFKTCRKIMQGDERNNCTILYENSSSDAAKALQEIVQPHTATLLVLKSSIETLFPTIIILFLGPWSDTNGRKPLVTFPFIGSIIYYSLFAIQSSFEIDTYWFLIPCLISSLMGGFPTILLTCFCYITDVTDSQNRSWRLGFLDFVLFGGQLVGYLVSPVLFKEFGYCVVFAVSAVSCAIGFAYSYFFLRETIYTGLGRSVKSIFKLTLIKDLFVTATKKRSGFDRGIFLCCLLMIAFHDDMMQGTATIVYLFTKRFGWSIMDFSTYSVVQLSVNMIGMMLLIKIIAPYLKLPETVSIIIASLSNNGNALAKAFARQSWHMYLATGIGIFSLAPASLVRSIISKTIAKHDVGKAFAITTTMEKIGPFITTPLFVLLHTNFIKTYPCPVWFLPAVLTWVNIILAIIVHYRWRRLRIKRSTRETG
ncbi:hypothetical protein TSAR_001737 [Trichomalopsis sarcophagae]|uniref:Major facilitator superfamily (MFS) profile domain-containing protein n=1 Tax=Trichomalopsis sarcophagae TaxID=543379 RepID=A0A232ENT2_9HYME|nr:hypothetical protein TSAR_001737 [Trichomalopsis sarcophagae]